MSSSIFLSLLEKFLNEELNAEELRLFLDALKDPANQEIVGNVLDKKIREKTYQGLSDKSKLNDMFDKALQKAALLEQAVPPENRAPVYMKPAGRTIRFIRRLAAACVIIALATTAYFLFDAPAEKLAENKKQEIKAPLWSDVMPGGNKAVLILGDGSTLVLDDANNGVLAQQGSTVITKKNGELFYHADPPSANGQKNAPVYNTMRTPRGGQFHLTLPDGTGVWLNAASSITYPSAFAGTERNVSVSGEAYFEVAKDPAKPFTVKLMPGANHSSALPPSDDKGFIVRVLGTHFNINSYTDEAAMKITLLEGSITLSDPSKVALQPVLLKLGQQMEVNASGAMNLVRNADIEQVMAWKNGFFSFKGVDIPTIMRQVARWYDVDVVYENGIPSGNYVGKPSRSLTAAQMLKVIEYSGVRFSIEGKRIVVKK